MTVDDKAMIEKMIVWLESKIKDPPQNGELTVRIQFRHGKVHLSHTVEETSHKPEKTIL